MLAIMKPTARFGDSVGPVGEGWSRSPKQTRRWDLRVLKDGGIRDGEGL